MIELISRNIADYFIISFAIFMGSFGLGIVTENKILGIKYGLLGGSITVIVNIIICIITGMVTT